MDKIISAGSDTVLTSNLPDRHLIKIFDDNGKVTITINMVTGNVIFGEGITPDEASKAFWRAVERLKPLA